MLSCNRKIFLYSVAQAVRMSKLQTAKAISVQNKELSLPDDSLTRALAQLNRLQAVCTAVPPSLSLTLFRKSFVT